MPTENRSSNTEIATDQLPPCADNVFKNGVSVCLVGDVSKHAAETICQSLSGVTGWKIDWHYIGGRTHIMALAQPAEQFQGEPGGYPPCDYCGIVPDHHPWHGSGLLSDVENRHIHACDACRGRLPLHPGQHKGEPVMRLECEKLLDGDGEYAVDFVKPGWLKECREKGGTFLLYTHADAGEVERLRSIERSYGLREALLEQVKGERDRMIARTMELSGQLADQDALLHKLKETLQREYWDEYAGLDETRELIDAALSASQEPSTPAAPSPNRLCHIDYTAHPHRCGCLKGDEESQRIYNEHCRTALARQP